MNAGGIYPSSYYLTFPPIEEIVELVRVWSDGSTETIYISTANGADVALKMGSLLASDAALRRMHEVRAERRTHVNTKDLLRHTNEVLGKVNESLARADAAVSQLMENKRQMVAQIRELNAVLGATKEVSL